MEKLKKHNANSCFTFLTISCIEIGLIIYIFSASIILTFLLIDAKIDKDFVDKRKRNKRN